MNVDFCVLCSYEGLVKPLVFFSLNEETTGYVHKETRVCRVCSQTTFERVSFSSATDRRDMLHFISRSNSSSLVVLVNKLLF